MKLIKKIFFGSRNKSLAHGRKAAQNFQQPKNIEDWIEVNKLAPPCPAEVKYLVLARHHIPGATWIETGTHLGGTAKFLASMSDEVYTIEPSEFYFQKAKQALAGENKIHLLKGSSEELLRGLLRQMKGKSLCLWLDGHWSGGETFCGKKETPIVQELKLISKARKSFPALCVCIDDYRLCWSSPNTYPPPNYFVRWAEKNELSWTIEQDIFIAKSLHLPLY